jgi:hypothetical protein
MHHAAAIAQLAPLRDCPLKAQAGFIGAAAFAIAVSVCENWLRVPIQPVLDGYLQHIVGRAVALAAALRKFSL